MRRHPTLIIAALAGATALALGGCTTSGSPAPAQEFDALKGSIIDPNRPVQRPKTHTVAPGETLIEIATNYGLDYRELARWNLISNPNLIEVGQALKLSSSGVEPEVQAVRTSSQAGTPQVRRTSAAELEALRNAPLPQVDPQAPQVRRRQKFIGESGERAGGDMVLLNEPRAQKLPYSEEARQRLTKDARRSPAVPASLPATRAPVNKRTEGNIVWSWPTDGKVVKNFGSGNKGIDIVAERGSPILASANGEVIYVGSGIEGFGQSIIVRHANEYVSLYAHNDQIFVAEGDKVKRGEPIAAMGDSGARSVGLHFQIRRGVENYDPRRFLPKNP
ncbi:MAG: peptidoglycan DD-metalloendopeptidase family protein [Betaproteobacteria bacterium]|nr:peptidoglycan DD-metalloendopeptidase family protein [Betaproteobacteria bacterium]